MCSSICIRSQFVRRDLLRHIICLSARQIKHEKGNIMYDMSGGIDLAITSLWRSVTSREEMSTTIMERSGKKRVVLSKPNLSVPDSVEWPWLVKITLLNKAKCFLLTWITLRGTLYLTHWAYMRQRAGPAMFQILVLSPNQRQTIVWTSAGIVFGPQETIPMKY